MNHYYLNEMHDDIEYYMYYDTGGADYESGTSWPTKLVHSPPEYRLKNKRIKHSWTPIILIGCIVGYGMKYILKWSRRRPNTIEHRP